MLNKKAIKSTFSALTFIIWINALFACGLCAANEFAINQALASENVSSDAVSRHLCSNERASQDSNQQEHEKCNSCAECISSWPYDSNKTTNYSEHKVLDLKIIPVLMSLILSDIEETSSSESFSYFNNSAHHSLISSLTLSPNAPPAFN